jgi:hypothetical protein
MMEVDYEPAGPKPIKKLSKDVINQIAAAEVSLVALPDISPFNVQLTRVDHSPACERHQGVDRKLVRCRIDVDKAHSKRGRTQTNPDRR